jgi:hypothetical protein
MLLVRDLKHQIVMLTEAGKELGIENAKLRASLEAKAALVEELVVALRLYRYSHVDCNADEPQGLCPKCIYAQAALDRAGAILG